MPRNVKQSTLNNRHTKRKTHAENASLLHPSFIGLLCVGSCFCYAVLSVETYSFSIRGVPTCTQIRMCVQLDAASIGFLVTVKPVLSDQSKIDNRRS